MVIERCIRTLPKADDEIIELARNLMLNVDTEVTSSLSDLRARLNLLASKLHDEKLARQVSNAAECYTDVIRLINGNEDEEGFSP